MTTSDFLSDDIMLLILYLINDGILLQTLALQFPDRRFKCDSSVVQMWRREGPGGRFERRFYGYVKLLRRAMFMNYGNNAAVWETAESGYEF